MTRLARFAATLAVAGILPASAIVAAQQPAAKVAEPPPPAPVDPPKRIEPAKPAAPAPTATTTVTTVEIQVPKAEPANVQVEKVETKTFEAKKVDVRKQAVKAEVQVIRRAGAAQMQNLEPQVQRYVVQLRPLTRSEIHLVLTACDPTPDQRAAIMGEEEKILKSVSQAMAQAQMGVRQVGANQLDPRRLIPQAMAEFLKSRLSPEQATRYKVESDAKAEFSRKVALSNLVMSIDEELMLSADQRALLAQKLESDWKEAWHASLQAQLNSNQMMPNLPNAVIVPILDPIQKRVWDKKQKSMTTYWGNFLMMGNFAIEEPAPPPPAGPANSGAKP